MATVTRRGNSYRIKVSCGYDVNGKQITKTTTWKPEPGMSEKQAEKESQRQAVLFEEKCRSGRLGDGSIRFADFADRWFKEYAEVHLKAKTVFRYQLLMPRINKAIGHIRLEKLQPHHLSSFYQNLLEEGIREDIKYHYEGDFKALLAERNLTKAKFAEEAGVCLSVLNSITQGKNISPASAQKVADKFGKRVRELFVPVGKDTLSSTTVLQHHHLISSILTTAVQWNLIMDNPCRRVKAPSKADTEAAFLDRNDAITMLTLLDKEPIKWQAIIKTILYSGMRRAEVCGLEWDRIDFEHNLIFIKKNSLYLPGEGVFDDSTKTKGSTRVTKAPTVVMEILKQYKVWQAEQRLKMGDRWQHSTKVFTTDDGRPIHPDTVTGWFNKFIKRNNLPYVNIKGLRHTNASLMIAEGVNIRTVAGRLGHSKTSTTTDIYAHMIRSAEEAAADVVELALEKKSI